MENQSINNFVNLQNLILYPDGLFVINDSGICNINNPDTSEDNKKYKLKGAIINNGSLQIENLYVCNKLSNFNHMYIKNNLYIGYYDYKTEYETMKKNMIIMEEYQKQIIIKI